MNLYEIDTPFGLLDKKTQKALKATKSKIEYYAYNGEWHDVPNNGLGILFMDGTTYRAKHKEYERGIVHSWHGNKDECPIDPDLRIDVVCQDYAVITGRAGNFNWNTSNFKNAGIIAFVIRLDQGEKDV